MLSAQTTHWPPSRDYSSLYEEASRRIRHRGRRRKEEVHNLPTGPPFCRRKRLSAKPTCQSNMAGKPPHENNAFSRKDREEGRRGSKGSKSLWGPLGTPNTMNTGSLLWGLLRWEHEHKFVQNHETFQITDRHQWGLGLSLIERRNKNFTTSITDKSRQGQCTLCVHKKRVIFSLCLSGPVS